MSKLAFLSALAIAGLVAAPLAQAESEQQQAVDDAATVVEHIRSGHDDIAAKARELIHQARAVMIIPELVKGGFFIGAQGGTGVLMARAGAHDWSDPAFFAMGAGSFGLQIGAEGGSVIFVVMNDGALKKLVNGTGVNLGGDLSIAVGPYGGGAQGATTANLGADLVAFSAQQGIFGGAAVQGGAVQPRQEWNAAYYGPAATPRAIIAGEVHNRGARGLIEALAIGERR